MFKSVKCLIVKSIIIFGISSVAYSQNKDSISSRSQFMLGINMNPFLLGVYNAVEIGPTICYSYNLNNHFEIGATIFSRQQFIPPKNEFGKANNISSSINLESNIIPHFGIVIGKKKIKNKFLIFGGLRHDYYKERLTNESYSINETYQYNELNLIYGLGYQLQYQLKNGKGLSLRVLIPTNRNPLDDANRYSLELGYIIALKNKAKSSN